MAEDFYPFVENDNQTSQDALEVRHPARIAVYDDPCAAPRVVVIEPSDVRTYLEEITLQVTQLSQAQGGTIPFMVIREIVENLIHAYFNEPTVSILDGGNTIRFSDQGPGIASKERALQYGTTSATEQMRRYIRGVGSGLPYAKQYMVDKGGSLRIEDNIAGGTVVTISTRPAGAEAQGAAMQPAPATGAPATWPAQPQQAWPQPQPQVQPPQPWQQVPQQGAYAPVWPQQAWPQQPWAQQGAYAAQPTYAAQGAPQPQAPDLSWVSLTVRGRAVLDYLADHDAVGPSDLQRTYGESQPTWTRELQTLEEQGLLRKDGQKRRLTAMGRAYVAQA